MRGALLAFLIPIALLGSVEADETDEAKTLAVKITTEGAAKFDTKDARAMAATYAEDAQLSVVSKDKDTNEIKTDLKDGRGAIEDYYRELFKDAGTVHSKNVVEYARRLDPDLLMIAGVFHPNLTDSDLKIPFVQVRRRHGETWLITNLQIFVVPRN